MPIIEDFDDDASTDGYEEIEITQAPSSKEEEKYHPRDYQNALISHSAVNFNNKIENFNPLNQPIKKNDHSSMAFGDSFTTGLGSNKYASIPSCPEEEWDEMNEDERTEVTQQFEGWLISNQLTDRKKFPRHKDWHTDLKKTGQLDFHPILFAHDFPKDIISENFKASVLNEASYEHFTFFEGVAPNKAFNQFDFYESEAKSDDEINENLAWSNEHRAQDYRLGQHIPPNTMRVFSNRGGDNTSHTYEIWGPGARPVTSFGTVDGKNKGQVGKDIDINTSYYHVPGRFTIIRVFPNEKAFCLQKETGQILQLKPGRYFIKERDYNYIGKATLIPNQAVKVIYHLEGSYKRSESLSFLAKSLEVVQLLPGHFLFGYSLNGPFVVNQPDVYIFDARAGFAYRDVISQSKHVISPRLHAQDIPYHIVRLQPGEYVVFRDNQNNTIFYSYNETEPELNTIHLSGLFYHFSGEVHHINDGTKTIENIDVLLNTASQFCVIQDNQRRIRFYENANHEPIILRRPFQFLSQASQAVAKYTYPNDVFPEEKFDNNPGNQVVRLRLNEAESALTMTQEGTIQILPPLLTKDDYYYLYQPMLTLCDIINRNQEGAQHFDIPNYGRVSIVNVASGELASCQLRNAYFLLNPQLGAPYVFTPPDKYLKPVNKNDSHVEAGDLHRVYIKPGERACAVVDGVAHILPDDENIDALENKEDGIYIFRARQQFKLHGPVEKTKKEYELGPYYYFTIEPGEVAHGACNGELKIWEKLGEHRINISQGERFNGFFEKNVAPIEVNQLPVLCKHGIGAHVDFSVTYSISDAHIPITRHRGSHDKLNEFVSGIACSVISDVCGEKPPKGFSDADIIGNEEEKLDENAKHITKLDDVRLEFEKRLKTNDEVQKSGIDISFVYIRDVIVNPEFLGAQQQTTLSLQNAHATNMLKVQALEGQKLENQRTQMQIEQELTMMELEKQKQEKQTEINVLTASQKGRAEAAYNKEIAIGQCETEKETVRIHLEQQVLEQQKQTELKQQELAQRKIDNQITVADATAAAQAEAAKETASLMAHAKAEKEAATLKKQAATLRLDTKKLDSQCEMLDAQVDSAKKALAQKAEFPDLSPEALAQCLMYAKWIETVAACLQVQQPNVNVFSMNPAEASQFYQDRMKQQLLFLQGKQLFQQQFDLSAQLSNDPKNNSYFDTLVSGIFSQSLMGSIASNTNDVNEETLESKEGDDLSHQVLEFN